MLTLLGHRVRLPTVAERGGPGRLRGHTSTSRQASLHPPKPSLGCAVGARPPLPHRRVEEAREQPGPAPPAGRPAAQPHGGRGPHRGSCPRPAPPRVRGWPWGRGPEPQSRRRGGGACAVTRTRGPLTLDPWNVHSFNGAAGASGAESRPRGACALGDGGARGPRPRAHVTRPPRGPEPGSRVGRRPRGRLRVCEGPIARRSRSRSLPEGLRETAGGRGPRLASTHPPLRKTSGGRRRLCPSQDTCECKSTYRRVQINKALYKM